MSNAFERLVVAAVLLLSSAVGCSSSGAGPGDALPGDAGDAGDAAVPADLGEGTLPDVGEDGGDGGGFDLYLMDVEPTPDPLGIYTIEPSKGKTVGGDQVVITGSGFEDGMVVIFGHQVANDVFVLSKKKATVITPAGFPGPVDIEIQAPGGQIYPP